MNIVANAEICLAKSFGNYLMTLNMVTREQDNTIYRIGNMAIMFMKSWEMQHRNRQKAYVPKETTSENYKANFCLLK